MRSLAVASRPGFIGICILSCSALLGACAEQPDLSSTAGRSFSAFQAAAYREPWAGGVYVVDGDLPVLDEEALRRLWGAGARGALTINQIPAAGGALVDDLWPAGIERALTYCISEEFGLNKPSVIEGMRMASDLGWELLANVDFLYLPEQDGGCTTQNDAVVFSVRPVSGAPYSARAFFPSFPRAQRDLLIDTDTFAADFPWPLKNVLAHELGHILGFRHEHIRPEGDPECAEDSQWRALTPYDAASVMHYPQCGGTSTDLSITAMDRDGVRQLYGEAPPNTPPMAQVNFPGEGDVVEPTFTVLTQVVDTETNVRQVSASIDGARLGNPVTAAPYTFAVVGLAAGAHTLELLAEDVHGLSTTTTVNFTVALPTPPPAPEDSGGCTSSGGRQGPGTLALLLGVALAARRRRRRHSRSARPR
ncbi:MAG: MYXO-CTERM sorting domain-containing protein [Kofleriaceae bacterium]